MITRILGGIIFLLFVLFLPWWFSFSAGIVFLVIYKNFWELILGAFLVDSLFAVPLPHFGGFTLVLTAAASFLFVARYVLSERLFGVGEAR